MKHAKHENRKSFKKWAMPGQRTMTDDMQLLIKRRSKSKNPYCITAHDYKP